MTSPAIKIRLGVFLVITLIGCYAACSSGGPPPCCQNVELWAPHVDTYIQLDAQWNDYVKEAVCQLEAATAALLDDADLDPPPAWDETKMICEPDVLPKEPPDDTCDFGNCPG